MADSLAAEEEDFVLSEAVCNAEVPSENVEKIDKQISLEASEFSSYFRSYEDAEYFAMLPLSRKQKHDVLKRARELQKV